MKITCGIFLFNKDNKLLICHVTNSKNQWSIPKGLVDNDEDYIDAAIRELREETSIVLENPQLEFIGDFKYKKTSKILKAFLYKIDYFINKDNLVCESMVNLYGKYFPEVDKHKWVSIEEAINVIHLTQISALSKISLKLLNKKLDISINL